MSDPFFLPPQSVVSFSGGRTSALMLRRVLDAHGGALPPDRVVLFCNTGKERQQTLDFVEECSRRWSVRITWLEYRYDDSHPVVLSKKGEPLMLDRRSHQYAEVTHQTASRDGEPFEQAVKARCDYRAACGSPGMLPHVVARYCTTELKTRTKGRYVKRHLKWEAYHNAIGMRADEPGRVAALTSCDYVSDPSCKGEIPVCPLAEAGVTERDVLAFWAAQPFDLALEQFEGNCDNCFLKKVSKVKELIRRRPDSADWWARMEEATGDRFRQDRPDYARLKVLAPAETPSMFDDPDELSLSCACTD